MKFKVGDYVTGTINTNFIAVVNSIVRGDYVIVKVIHSGIGLVENHIYSLAINRTIKIDLTDLEKELLDEV